MVFQVDPLEAVVVLGVAGGKKVSMIAELFGVTTE